MAGLRRDEHAPAWCPRHGRRVVQAGHERVGLEPVSQDHGCPSRASQERQRDEGRQCHYGRHAHASSLVHAPVAVKWELAAGCNGSDVDLSLDHWLPDPQVRTRHERTANATPDGLWRAAETDLFRCYPFTVLAEGERWVASGLCGRIWTLQRDYPRIDSPEDFLGWDRPGTVRVLFAHWIEPASDGHAAIVSESRVQAVDRRAGLRLRALWTLIGRFERLIGAEALRVAANRAEAGG